MALNAQERDILLGLVVEQARRDPNVFIELVLLDERGHYIKQAPIHREMQDFISTNDRGVIEEPREHGKTTQLVGRCVWEIGNDPTIRIRTVCSADDLSIARGKAVRDLCEVPLVQRVFPHLVPGREWSDTRFSVERKTVVPESTFEAKGVMSKGTGGRSDLLFFDDVDDEEVVVSKTKRQRNWDRISNVWLNTLTPKGRSFFVCTPWHKQDSSHRAQDNGWPVLSRPIRDMRPVWPERWSEEALIAKKRDIGSLAYSRGYELVPLSEHDAPIKGQWFRFWETASDFPRFNAIVVVCDPAIALNEKADYTCIGVLGVTTKGHVYLLEMLRSRMDFPATLKTLIGLAEAVHDRYKIRPVIGVEAVAYQAALPQQLRLDTPYPIVDIKATKSKFVRISKLAVHLENGRVFLHGKNGSVHKDQAVLFEEAIGFPAEEHDDAVDMLAYGVEMALQYARRSGAFVG